VVFEDHFTQQKAIDGDQQWMKSVCRARQDSQVQTRLGAMTDSTDAVCK